MPKTTRSTITTKADTLTTRYSVGIPSTEGDDGCCCSRGSKVEVVLEAVEEIEVVLEAVEEIEVVEALDVVGERGVVLIEDGLDPLLDDGVLIAVVCCVVEDVVEDVIEDVIDGDIVCGVDVVVIDVVGSGTLGAVEGESVLDKCTKETSQNGPPQPGSQTHQSTVLFFWHLPC
jgi:hypothetical protein